MIAAQDEAGRVGTKRRRIHVRVGFYVDQTGAGHVSRLLKWMWKGGVSAPAELEKGRVPNGRQAVERPRRHLWLPGPGGRRV